VHGARVRRGVDRDGLDTELVESADDSHRDLPAVRTRTRENIVRERPADARDGSSSNSSWPNSTGWRSRRGSTRTIASTSAFTSFISFIASRMQSVWPARRLSLLDERRRPGLRRAVERPDHRRLDADEAVRGRHLPAQLGLVAAASGAVSAAADGPSRRDGHAHADSSIVTSPMPVSCTMRTSSRIRSAAAWSTPPWRSDSSPASGRESCAAAARRRRRTGRAGAAPPRWRRGPRPAREPPAARRAAASSADSGSAVSATARCDVLVDRRRRRAERPSTSARTRRRRPSSGSRRAR
jgi:hypothetical protein